MKPESHLEVLINAAERDRAAAQTHYLRASIMGEATHNARNLVYLLWALCLLAGYFGVIVPAWAIVIAAALGFPSLSEALKTPARREYAMGKTLDDRASEVERRIAEARSSGSTSGDTGASRN